MPETPRKIHPADCPSRQLFEQILDKWSMLILFSLTDGALRFNAIRRSIEGITQKALTRSLRRLERNGLVERRVINSSPVAVEYRVTELGHSLEQPFQALHDWTLQHLPGVEKARADYDRLAGTTPSQSSGPVAS